MKITKIPGLGRFGIYIDGVDFGSITDEEWRSIGQLHLESLVTIIRDVKITPNNYEKQMTKWGDPRFLADYQLSIKYRYGQELDPDDAKLAEASKFIMATDINPETRMTRVSGGKDSNGNPLGMFASGELLWHSNESGNLCFAPGVSLLGVKNVVGSSTGFVTTPDWYESQTESFQSELDEMIVRHKFTPGKINPGLPEEQDIVVYKNMCPEPSELPLICMSPGGIKGVHYSVNTIESVVGMTDQESQSLFDYINKTLFVEKYTYDHWWPRDNDLLLFDNSITLHRRLGNIDGRLCYRLQFDYNKLNISQDRYLMEPFNTDYHNELKEVNRVLGITTDPTS
jgi:alpha-ketoglutarate-dependent taurine dioxygenase